jgi:hypothetical protein|tara:strand:- start:197 stop:664 length:468 start_codon:yes stop_codon:yes gene_type:complete
MAGITKIFWGITLFLIVYSIGFDFPISGDIVLGTWFIFYFIFVFYVINNKTTVVKNPKTGAYEEITIKKSIAEQEAELRYLEEEARAQEKLRQKKLNPKKQVEIQNKQRLDKHKVVTGNISGSGLMDKIKRLKKLYINGTLTKAEFEQAKNKLLT